MKYISSRPVIGSDFDCSSVGHNFVNSITGLLLSKRFNLEYIHTPFQGDSARFNEFLNFSSVWKQKTDINPSKITNDLVNSRHYFDSEDKFYNIQNQIDSYPDNTLINLPQDSFPGVLTQYYNDIIPDLQKAYWTKQRDIPLVFDGNKISVAIHIRRGWSIRPQDHPSRWTNLDYYINIINNLNNVFGIENLDIHIFTDILYGYSKTYQTDGGTLKEDYKTLLKENVTLHLGGNNESDFSDFHNMCSADILVTAKSSFSYMAAYITKGSVIFTPFYGAGGDVQYEKQYTHKWGDDRILLGDNLDFKLLKKRIIL